MIYLCYNTKYFGSEIKEDLKIFPFYLHVEGSVWFFTIKKRRNLAVLEPIKMPGVFKNRKTNNITYLSYEFRLLISVSERRTTFLFLFSCTTDSARFKAHRRSCKNLLH